MKIVENKRLDYFGEMCVWGIDLKVISKVCRWWKMEKLTERQFILFKKCL